MENINFVIGSNGNIGKEIVNHDIKSNNLLIGIDVNNPGINNLKYKHWGLDCTIPNKIEDALKNLYLQNKFRVKNLVLCAVLDSVPNKYKNKKDTYNYGLSNQDFSEINQRILVNITSQLFILKIFEPYLFSKSSVCLFSSIYGYKSPDHRIYEDNFICPQHYQIVIHQPHLSRSLCQILLIYDL